MRFGGWSAYLHRVAQPPSRSPLNSTPFNTASRVCSFQGVGATSCMIHKYHRVRGLRVGGVGRVPASRLPAPVSFRLCPMSRLSAKRNFPSKIERREEVRDSAGVGFLGTSLIRNSGRLGPFSGNMPNVGFAEEVDLCAPCGNSKRLCRGTSLIRN